MGRSFFELEQNIKVRVNEGTELTLQSSKINQKVEKYILHTLELILEKCGRSDLIEMAYTITKELCINGMKANQKRIFFEERGLDIANPEDYSRGVEEFRNEFSDEMNEVYGKKAIQRGIFVKIYLTYSDDGLCIEVVNNTPIAAEEERRMREKMKKSMAYNDIAEFYMDNMDNTEGAGLGIALIMILMKSAEMDPNLFRIYTLPDRTVARCEVPFNANYVSKREQKAGT
ncbi:MAG: histidine kinase [Leptospiraceae bacterium]|nr:histidine kinase [Leptospiraceae bacterium]